MDHKKLQFWKYGIDQNGLNTNFFQDIFINLFLNQPISESNFWFTEASLWRYLGYPIWESSTFFKFWAVGVLINCYLMKKSVNETEIINDNINQDGVYIFFNYIVFSPPSRYPIIYRSCILTFLIFHVFNQIPTA